MRPQILDEEKLDESSVQHKIVKSPLRIKPLTETPSADCLLVSCSELVSLFKNEFKLTVQESFLEEAAI